MLHGVLRQSTASQSRMVGPFIDDTDSKTVETGLTIANTDVKLSKNGATGVNKNSGGGTHRDNGMYSLTFDATDSDTVGELEGSILVSGALVVPFKFIVMAEGPYDTLYADSPTIITTEDIGLVYESAIATGGIVSTTSFNMDDTISYDGDWIGQLVTIKEAGTPNISTRWITAVNNVNNNITISSPPAFTAAVGDAVRVDIRMHPTYFLEAYNASKRGESISDRDQIEALINSLLEGIIFGTAQTGTLNTTGMTTNLTGYLDDELIGATVVFTGGTADGQRAEITDYASAGGSVSFSGGIITAPADGDTFKIV